MRLRTGLGHPSAGACASQVVGREGHDQATRKRRFASGGQAAPDALSFARTTNDRETSGCGRWSKDAATGAAAQEIFESRLIGLARSAAFQRFLRFGYL